MANRENTLLIKRSNVLEKIPLLSNLTLGELALNTADAKLYSLYTSGATAPSEVRQIGWDRISRTGDTVFGDFVFSGDVIVSEFTANTINFSSIPNENNSAIEILSLNSLNGDVEYRDVKTIGNNITEVDADYNLTLIDNVVGVDSSILSIRLTLPDSVNSGKVRYTIKDIGLNASANNIIIETSGSDVILSSISINEIKLTSDGESVTLVNSENGQWWVI
jgi:hypothetical protein